MSTTRVVLDTNVLVSAIIYKGKPGQIIELSLQEKIQVIISNILLSELIEVLTKKFFLSQDTIDLIEQDIRNNYDIVYPTKSLNIVRDEDDNRVLEAAVEGKCNFIVTGDKDLLELAKYKNIKIIRPDQFLENFF